MTYTTASTAQRVRDFVLSRSIGEPFTMAEVRALGPRGAIDHAMGRLTKEGLISNVTRGMYVRPKTNQLVGTVPPAPDAIVRAWANSSQSVVEIDGAEAARQFGLTTQVPMRPTYKTTGRSRTMVVGATEIELRHASPSQLLFAGTGAGRAYAALRYLGKAEVTQQTVEAIKAKLTSKEFSLLISGRRFMPAWLSNVLSAYEFENA